MDPGFSVLGSILNLGSPFSAFLHLQVWRMAVNGSWGFTWSSTFGDPSHCYRFPTFQFYVILFISIFSPLATFVP